MKPELFDDPDLGALSAETRWLFSGLLTQADKRGRLEDDPRRLKVRICPYDTSDVDALLDQLAAAEFILRYQSNGKRYLQIRTFEKHQRPHPKEPESVIPPPNGRDQRSRGKTRQAVERHGRSARKGNGKGREWEGNVLRNPTNQGSEVCTAPPTCGDAEPSSTESSGRGRVDARTEAVRRGALEPRNAETVQGPPAGRGAVEPRTATASRGTVESRTADEVLTFPTVGPVKAWALTQGQIDEWAGTYERPTAFVFAETRKALAWVKANPTRRKTARGMPAFLQRWLSRAVDRSRPMTASDDDELSPFSRRLKAAGEAFLAEGEAGEDGDDEG